MTQGAPMDPPPLRMTRDTFLNISFQILKQLSKIYHYGDNSSKIYVKINNLPLLPPGYYEGPPEVPLRGASVIFFLILLKVP